MSARIDKLTPEQEARLTPFRDEWFAWGTCTARADRAKAEVAILALRAEIGVTTQPVFVWCESPATSLLALHVLKSEAWERFVADLCKKLGVRSSLWSSLRSSLGSSLESSLESSLGSSLWSSLGSSLWSSLESSLGSSLESSLGDAWWGQHESYWIAFYLFCRDIVGVEYEKNRSRQLDMWRDIAQSCCWWWCYENYVVVSERPTVVSMDARRVHSLNGPAIAFSDGWKVYAVHGVRIPAEWIEKPGALTPQLALTHRQIEQRRAACELLGWNKILAALDAKEIDKDRDPEIGTLLRVDLPDAPGSQFLRVRCGTGRDFVLPVPGDLLTARAANAWTYSLTPTQYNPDVRT